MPSKKDTRTTAQRYRDKAAKQLKEYHELKKAGKKDAAFNKQADRALTLRRAKWHEDEDKLKAKRKDAAAKKKAAKKTNKKK